MTTEDSYDDLTAQFDALDSAIEDAGFSTRVMREVKPRDPWRTPILFGACGLGVGAIVSNLAGVFEFIEARSPQISVSIGEVQSPTWTLSAVDPIWLAASLVVIASCAAVLVSERT